MRLAAGIVTEKETTFGRLKFSALRREVRITDDEGDVTDEIKERTYNLKSKGQGRMIQVSIPATAGEKNFDYNIEVELINPVAAIQWHLQPIWWLMWIGILRLMIL